MAVHKLLLDGFWYCWYGHLTPLAPVTCLRLPAHQCCCESVLAILAKVWYHSMPKAFRVLCRTDVGTVVINYTHWPVKQPF